MKLLAGVVARAWGGPQRTVTLTGVRHNGIDRCAELWNAVGKLRHLFHLIATSYQHKHRQNTGR